MPSSLDANPSRDVHPPIPLPWSSSARYSTCPLPSFTTDAGLNVCVDSQCTGPLRIGQSKTDPGFGSMTGSALSGRRKGPSIQSAGSA